MELGFSSCLEALLPDCLVPLSFRQTKENVNIVTDAFLDLLLTLLNQVDKAQDQVPFKDGNFLENLGESLHFQEIVNQRDSKDKEISGFFSNPYHLSVIQFLQIPQELCSNQLHFNMENITLGPTEVEVASAVRIKDNVLPRILRALDLTEVKVAPATGAKLQGGENIFRTAELKTAPDPVILAQGNPLPFRIEEPIYPGSDLTEKGELNDLSDDCLTQNSFNAKINALSKDPLMAKENQEALKLQGVNLAGKNAGKTAELKPEREQVETDNQFSSIVSEKPAFKEITIWRSFEHGSNHEFPDSEIFLTENNSFRMGSVFQEAHVVSDAQGNCWDEELGRATEQEIVKQIVARAQLRIEKEMSTMKINLKPEFLGKLELVVTFKDGLLHAHFIAEKPVVANLIETRLPELRQSLEQRGFSWHQVSVSVGSQAYAEGFNQTNYGAQGFSPQQLHSFDPAGSGAGAEEGAGYDPLGGLGLIDCLI